MPASPLRTPDPVAPVRGLLWGLVLAGPWWVGVLLWLIGR
jgi:hypothetical protein